MSIIDTIQTLPWPILHHWWYWIVFFSSVLEASPLFGSFIPGHTIVILWGFLAKLGILHLGSVLVVSSLWAILGDFLGYWLGRRYGHDFIVKYGKYLFFKEVYFEKTKLLIAQHTGKTIIIGRFNPVIRAFVPFVAGSSGIRFLKFSFYNVIGGLCWAISSVLIGFVFGQSYELAARYIGRFIVAAMIISIILIVLYRFINKKKHIFLKYRPYLLILNVSSLYLFSKMAEDVIDSELMTRWDIWVHGYIVSLWNPLLTRIMIFLSDIGNPIILGTLAVLLFAFLAQRKRWYDSWIVFLSMAGGWGLEYLAKVFMERPRPDNALIMIPTSYSFPSAHATIAIIFFSLLIYLFQERIQAPLGRIIFVASNICIFLLIGFSRVYLNVHWMSDVLAGFGLGMFWLTFVILSVRIAGSFLQKKKESKSRKY